MKNSKCISAALTCFAIFAASIGVRAEAFTESPIDPCLTCHAKETPAVVAQWEAGKHSKVGVKCYVCHFAEPSEAKGEEHNGFYILTAVEVKSCDSCHPENAAELRKKFSKESKKHP